MPVFRSKTTLDKVRPESQSEHTPVTPVGPVASPLEADRPHTCSTSAATGEFIKKNNRRPGQTLGHDSPDRRQWIKSGPKVRASTRR